LLGADVGVRVGQRVEARVRVEVGHGAGAVRGARGGLVVVRARRLGVLERLKERRSADQGKGFFIAL
jgi:hypothetical protein